MEEEHLEKINQAQKEVEKLIQQYEDTMHDELESFKKLSVKNDKVPTLL